jgi:hypothetical protein
MRVLDLPMEAGLAEFVSPNRCYQAANHHLVK